VPGLTPYLRAWVVPFLDRVRKTDWNEGFREILGVEVPGFCEVSFQGGKAVLNFRADRVDNGEDGLILTDYKSGKSMSGKVDTLIARGMLLQGAAYTDSAEGAVGRYLYLDKDSKQREVLVTEENLAAFQDTLSIALSGWDSGIFFPRLADSSGNLNRMCSYCSVREACFKGDPGMGNHLREWMDTRPEDDPTGRLWRLTAAEAKKT